jgi:hypothetical protein
MNARPDDVRLLDDDELLALLDDDGRDPADLSDEDRGAIPGGR